MTSIHTKNTMWIVNVVGKVSSKRVDSSNISSNVSSEADDLNPKEKLVRMNSNELTLSFPKFL